MKQQIKERPWALQRIVFDQLWQDTKGRDAHGRPVRVAVIDTGVDNTNPQLAEAVDTKHGWDFLHNTKDGKNETAGDPKAPKDGTYDPVGHGTKVAGIIAARPRAGTGFVGLAPEATIIPLRQNDEKGSGTAATLAQAIRKAIAADADVINISQDTTKPLTTTSDLAAAVKEARRENIVVVASAGNDGLDGRLKDTYPAAYAGVLAVASSDRNNERTPFSQSGDFIGVAAPGVDMVSTVPKGGQCVDNGTSFSAPYVAGVAALLKAKHPDWKEHQIVAQIEQTAERTVNGRDSFVGWGVVDPVRALTEDAHPIDRPSVDNSLAKATPPDPAAWPDGETPQERMERYATYGVGAGGVAVAVIAGAAVVWRDARKRDTHTRATGRQ
ncbi:type VII secretion-associated serine protease mycosin [Streptomyces sp. Je 1-4]|uniref:type VII secretion-associated serine protease mycosin n=1 Tax=Streptomyces TaxID=1883 RepID=UPI0021CA219B|nr:MULTISPECIES: type VII secretion-associated serine protease mycosin [unclassified Streptomyces]MCR8573600.1 type VII secretion-associated serine protease mycosin [Streptomyces sp. Isolate_219]UYB40163.1 type VII secretion-associated serine protease mycosin [Streptomyces sp. Je 1-4]UZQ36254.1 type VII secretion-associated serine protease mycosin [Streptomyces sp. Je 1-4] [Streptomyces sp. Je 1-4 4N24]UZQ43672.1 type VII secretion-associated serine protease mycosin [Streptomyces sp. Je 1-4] [S